MPSNQELYDAVCRKSAKRNDTNVTGSAAATLMAANSARLGFTIQNADTVDIYIRFSTSNPSASNHDLRLAAGQLYSQMDNMVYTGAVTALPVSATTSGGVRCSEFIVS